MLVKVQLEQRDLPLNQNV